MNRRRFLAAAATLAAGLAADPEKLLWTPAKTIFIPPASRPLPTYDQFKQWQNFEETRQLWLDIGIFDPVVMQQFDVWCGHRGDDIRAQIVAGDARARELGFK